MTRREICKLGALCGGIGAAMSAGLGRPASAYRVPQYPMAPKPPAQAKAELLRFECFADSVDFELVGHELFTTPFRGFLTCEPTAVDPMEGWRLQVRDFYTSANGRQMGRVRMIEDDERQVPASTLEPHSPPAPFPARNRYHLHLLAKFPHLAPRRLLRSSGVFTLVADVEKYPPDEQRYELQEPVAFEDEDDPGHPVIRILNFPVWMKHSRSTPGE
ncbi:MAG: hypothetical protein AB1679_03530 [Actinomycetota bacterium]